MYVDVYISIYTHTGFWKNCLPSQTPGVDFVDLRGLLICCCCCSVWCSWAYYQQSSQEYKPSVEIKYLKSVELVPNNCQSSVPKFPRSIQQVYKKCPISVQQVSNTYPPFVQQESNKSTKCVQTVDSN